MADVPDPSSPYWFTLYEVHERCGFPRVRELARKGHIDACCAGLSVPGVKDKHERQKLDATWWAPLPSIFPLGWDPGRNYVRFKGNLVEDGVPRTYDVIAYGVLFHIPPHIQQLLDEGREAELDQKPAPVQPVPPVPALLVQAPDPQKKRKLNGLAVTKQIIAYMESKNVHLAEALRAVSAELGVPFKRVERRFHVHEDRAREELKRDAALSAKPKPKR